MDTWEYDWLWLSRGNHPEGTGAAAVADPIMEELNERGRLGWEVVTPVRITWSEPGWQLERDYFQERLLLRRRRHEVKEGESFI